MTILATTNASQVSTLPGGWLLVPLEQLIAPVAHAITDGPFGSNLKSAHYTDTGPRVIRLQNIGDGVFKDEEAHIAPERYELLRKHAVSPGNIAMALLGEVLPRACIVPDWLGLAIVKADCVKIVLDESIVDSRFVCTALNSQQVRSRTSKLIKGIGRPRLNLRQARQITVPIAPRPEQVRIADRIDELFTDLSAGVAALERVRRKLKRYRSAVLHAAVTGKLHTSTTPTWASESNWRSLGEIISEIEQGWSPKCDREPATNSEQWAVMTTTAIQPMAFDGGENKKLPATLNPYADLELRVGDILITRAGPRKRAGIACLVRKTRQRLILCDKAYRFRCKADQATGEFIEMVLNARPITDSIERMKTGSSDSGLNLTQSRFRSLTVPIPPIDEQNEIVELVQEKLSQIDAMEAEVERGLARASRLRQAILKSSFSGKLVPQDPSDDPAAMLLDRIKAVRAQQHAASNGREKRTTIKKAVRKRAPAKASRAAKASAKRKQK